MKKSKCKQKITRSKSHLLSVGERRKIFDVKITKTPGDGGIARNDLKKMFRLLNYKLIDILT